MTMTRDDLLDEHGRPKVQVGKLPPSQYCHFCELPYQGDARVAVPFTNGMVHWMHPACYVQALEQAEEEHDG